mmetsp:Transcript_7117/g.13964  ORF Transcript_7117/g.13964 Transcript_7117/m.13964 type:complete len:204 (+) Transcript_7117:98-709(+)
MGHCVLHVGRAPRRSFAIACSLAGGGPGSPIRMAPVSKSWKMLPAIAPDNLRARSVVSCAACSAGLPLPAVAVAAFPETRVPCDRLEVFDCEDAGIGAGCHDSNNSSSRRCASARGKAPATLSPASPPSAEPGAVSNRLGGAKENVTPSSARPRSVTDISMSLPAAFAEDVDEGAPSCGDVFAAMFARPGSPAVENAGKTFVI